MARAPRKACVEPRCPGYAMPGKARCPMHQGARDAALAGRRLQFYDTNTWRELSRATLAANPVCVDCGGPATQADHLLSARLRPDLALEPSNVVSRCRRCHSARTSKEHSWNRRRR